jgi:hypothetical protein
MNILKKIKKIPFILGILSVLLIIGIVYAAEYYQVNSGAQATINEWSVCKKVTNNNALAIFVPTKTAAEWTAFRTYASGVSYTGCCQDNDADGYGVAGYSGTALGCTYDGVDCDDSCATCYPGSTAYTSSADGKDQDCDGTVDEFVAPPTHCYAIAFGYETNACTTKCASYGQACRGIYYNNCERLLSTTSYSCSEQAAYTVCSTTGCQCLCQEWAAPTHCYAIAFGYETNACTTKCASYGQACRGIYYNNCETLLSTTSYSCSEQAAYTVCSTTGCQCLCQEYRFY